MASLGAVFSNIHNEERMYTGTTYVHVLNNIYTQYK